MDGRRLSYAGDELDRAGDRLRGHRPQGPGLRIPGRGGAAAAPARPDAAPQPALHRDHPRPAAGRAADRARRAGAGRPQHQRPAPHHPAPPPPHIREPSHECPGTRRPTGSRDTRSSGPPASWRCGYFRDRAGLTIEHKGQQDLVSIADRAVEDLLRERAGGGLPGRCGAGRGGRRRAATPTGPGCSTRSTAPSTSSRASRAGAWSRPMWSTAGSMIGLTYDPVHDEMFIARRGGGALRNGAPVRVSGNQGVDTSCLRARLQLPPGPRRPMCAWSTRPCRSASSTGVRLDRDPAVLGRRRPLRRLRHAALLVLGLPRRADPGRGGRRPGHRFRPRLRPARQRRRGRLHAGSGAAARGDKRSAAASRLTRAGDRRMVAPTTVSARKQ